jgi:hypothetical protein
VDTGCPSDTGSPSPLTCGAVRGEATSEEAPFRAPVVPFGATSDADDSRLEECLQKKQKLKVSRGVTQTSDAEALEEEGGGVLSRSEGALEECLRRDSRGMAQAPEGLAHNPSMPIGHGPTPPSPPSAPVLSLSLVIHTHSPRMSHSTDACEHSPHSTWLPFSES